MEPTATPTTKEPAEPGSDTTPLAEPGLTMSWEASEFVQHDKPAWWYPAFLGLMLLFCALAALLHQLLTVPLVVVVALAVWVYSRKPPRTLHYSLDDYGLTIEAKLLPYNHFRSYSPHSAVGWEEIELEPAKRFSPRLTLIISKDNRAATEQILALHLPKVERSHDLIEQFARYIKF